MEQKKISYKTKLKNLIENKKSVLEILQATQLHFGYLPRFAMEEISTRTKISSAEIYGVATFYNLFKLEPTGKHTISVCLGTACFVKGSRQILDKFCDVLKIGIGQTTSDGIFSIAETRCLGCCGMAPVVSVDNKIYGNVKIEDVQKIINEWKVK